VIVVYTEVEVAGEIGILLDRLVRVALIAAAQYTTTAESLRQLAECVTRRPHDGFSSVSARVQPPTVRQFEFLQTRQVSA
jgi:hypothetical protein